MSEDVEVLFHEEADGRRSVSIPAPCFIVPALGCLQSAKIPYEISPPTFTSDK